MKQNELTHPYLTRQIIAYIGNKRSLLSLIGLALDQCRDLKEDDCTFLDLFAGSGIVSRYARFRGFQVLANDWEYFSWVISRSYLSLTEEKLSRMFSDRGGLQPVLDELNSLDDPRPEDRYMAVHYAPSEKDISKADFRTERLFYTRENALKIDAVRNRIEEWYPGPVETLPENQADEKALLLSLLIYNAATHTNTSGVFKAYHKGFGGHNGDALKRILSPVHLAPPVVCNGPPAVSVTRTDANECIKTTGEVDVAYLDPPYNQHQYGSNYHILNTVALWDKLPVSNDLDEKGVLKIKAGIRKDWVNTRSDYCYRDKAVEAFSRLLSGLKARYILVSYSTEGCIPFSELVDLCSRKGRVSLVTNEYIKYRGGKQSLNRLNLNIEFVLIINCRETSDRKSLKEIESLITVKRLGLLLKKSFHLGVLKSLGNLDWERGEYRLKLGRRKEIVFESDDFLSLKPVSALTEADCRRLIQKLEPALCTDRISEMDEVMLRLSEPVKDRKRLIRRLPGLLKKVAHKKYKKEYYNCLKQIQSLSESFPLEYKLIEKNVADVAVIAEKRFSS